MPSPMLIEQVSDTAYWTAAYRAIESKRDDALFADPWAERLAGEKGSRIASEMWDEGRNFWFFSIRTYVFDQLILQTVFQHGVDAVLNLGAGLDIRPYRLRLPETLRWYEVDLPPMVAHMEREMDRYAPNCQLERRACDLTDTESRQALFSEVGRMARKVLIVAEGVVSYFDEAQIDSLALDLGRRPNFCYWIQDHYSRNVIQELQKKWQGRMCENARLRFDHRNRRAFFLERGWKVSKNFSAMDEAKRLGRWNRPIRPIWQWFKRSACERSKEDLGYMLLERVPGGTSEWLSGLYRPETASSPKNPRSGSFHLHSN